MSLKKIKISKLKNKIITNLEKCPFKRGIVLKILIKTPKKPNSAKRAIIKIELSTFKITFAYIPGIGHNLKKHAIVLISGRGVRDLPSISYRCIRHKYDLEGVKNRFSRKSIYGVQKIKI